MKLFNSSGWGQHYAVILVILVLLTFATSAFAGDLSTEIDNLVDHFEDVETKLGIEIAVLANIYSRMWDLRHSWDHADIALRNAGIEALSDVVQTDFINIIMQLWTIEGRTNDQIDMKRSANSYMEEAISIFQTQLWKVYNLESDYYIAWMNAATAVTSHNSNHSSPTETDHLVPVYHTHRYSKDIPKFPCPECDEEFLSVISPHQKKCGINDDTDVMGCGNIYYTCQPDDVKKHAPKYCGKDVWIQPTSSPHDDHLFFGVYGVCGNGYRKCTTSKRHHAYSYEIVLINGGSYVSGCRPYYTRPTKCGDGYAYVPPGAVHRPSKDIEDMIDISPSCDTCLDSSDYCPNASAH